MDINGWLTVITVFMAVLTLLPKEDLFLRFQRICKLPIILFAIINIAVIPFLLFFENIVQRCSYFKHFTVSWGFEAKNIAFALFYISFIWILFRLFLSKPKPKVNEESIAFFIRLLNEKPFEEFFNLFTKYSPAKHISDNWLHYKPLIFQPNFLNQILQNKPSYLLQFWSKFDSEDDFKLIFRLFLENPKSVYYSEIRDNWNSYSLLEDKPFLCSVIKENLKQSISNGIFMVLTDNVSNHLQSENSKIGIYNQEYYYRRQSEDDGFDLPVYYHIRFIGLIYSSAIENHIDISTISYKYTNLTTVYSNMIEQMLNNLSIDKGNAYKEYPTNYHWLIDKIFDLQNNWLTLFSDERYLDQRYFDEKSSYVSFIPLSIGLCLSELYKGLSKGKITIEFLNHRIYYNILSQYLNNSLNDIIKSSIEKEVLSRIPRNHISSILDYSLNTKYAINYKDFINEDFKFVNEIERKTLTRFLDFLRTNKMLEDI